MVLTSRASRVRAWLFAGLLGVVIALGLWGNSQPPSRSEDGPLQIPDPWGSAYTLEPGEVVGMGLAWLRVDGNRPAVIEAVRIEGGSGIEQLGALVAAPGRGFGGLDTKNWPPRHPDLKGIDLIPAVGATISPDVQHPGDGWELFVGLKPLGSGYSTTHGIVVDYRVDGKRYRARFPIEIAICNDPSVLRDGHCPFVSETG